MKAVSYNELPEEKQDNLTMEMLLVDMSNAIAEYKRRGGEMRILNDNIINSMTDRDLADLAYSADTYLRVKGNI